MKPLVLQQHGISVSDHTIRNRLAEQRAKMKRGYKVPILTDRHKRERYLFAIKHKRKKWERVIFSDEKIMQLYRQSGQIRVLPNEHPILPTPKKALKLCTGQHFQNMV